MNTTSSIIPIIIANQAIQNQGILDRQIEPINFFAGLFIFIVLSALIVYASKR